MEKKYTKLKIIGIVIIAIVAIGVFGDSQASDSQASNSQASERSKVCGKYYKYRNSWNHTVDGMVIITEDNFYWESFGAKLADASWEYNVDEDGIPWITIKGEKQKWAFMEDEKGNCGIARWLDGQFDEVYIKQ